MRCAFVLFDACKADLTGATMCNRHADLRRTGAYVLILDSRDCMLIQNLTYAQQESSGGSQAQATSSLDIWCPRLYIVTHLDGPMSFSVSGDFEFRTWVAGVLLS